MIISPIPLPFQEKALSLQKNCDYGSKKKQIDDRGYAIPYETDGRKVVKVGVTFNAKSRTIADWTVA
ncbi:MAG: PD-(D/E)XK nuclease domain-containing protein [Prevotella sp.]|nr:PD-(D/E)XK nuclease domain-containing protein [Prevotella sp.]